MLTESPPAAGRRFASGPADWIRPLQVPVRDPRFWVIQALVLGIDVAHTLLEDQQLLVSDSELYLLSVSVFLIPVVYAGLSFGLRGAVPTALWALVLSIPEISHHDRTTKIGILTQFAIVLAIAVIVGLRVDREKAATRALEHANQQLSKLNATAFAVAGSLDLDEVLQGTLRATLDPRRQQTAWIRLIGGDGLPERTELAASGVDAPSSLGDAQRRLTDAACLTGELQTNDFKTQAAFSVVAPLRAEGRIQGAIGLTQPAEAGSADELQVITAIANQLSVALNNIIVHQRNREAVESLKVVKRNLETYIELATEAQEEERKRLSRELHDDILQSLVAAKAQIESADCQERSDRVSGRLLKAQEVLDDAIANVRRYSRDLRPALLDDLGLVDAVDWLVGDLKARTQLAVELETTGTTHRLSSRDELHIFRIVQEALHNVERHSHATRARVRLSYTGDLLRVWVADNGCGMTPTQVRSGSGHAAPGLGMRGMDERTKLLKGTLTLRSQEGQGTELTLEVPLPPAEPTQIMLGG